MDIIEFREQAEDWYNNTPKAELLAFAKKRHLPIYENRTTLKEDWNDQVICAKYDELIRGK